MAVPFFMVIVEIFLYSGLALFFLNNIFLVYFYIFLRIKKNIKIVILWAIFNLCLLVTSFILFVFAFLNIFDPSYNNYIFDNEATFKVIIEFNIIVFVISLFHFLIIMFFSKYF